MCGIIGYVGHRAAEAVLLNGLKRLEYRGYDSAGIAVVGNKIELYKRKGQIEDLRSTIPKIHGKIGIGHTRWATHGRPSDDNAHPFLSCDEKIAIVHNGIIENYITLREELIEKGHKFNSTTDSEVLVHLIEEYYTDKIEDAVRKALLNVNGTYAMAIIRLDESEIVVARNESPLVIGVGENEHFVASDVPAFLKFTRKAIYLDDKEIAVLNNSGIKITDFEGKAIKKAIQKVPWDTEEIEKAGYEHFMLKEIHEQPKVIRSTLSGRVSEIEPTVTLENMSDEDVERITAARIVACGSSYHASLVGKCFLERLARIQTTVDFASEFRYAELALDRNTLIIALTQSGETADTLGALRIAKEMGCKTLAITNVLGSSVSRIADNTLYTRAGPEICVAATKTFISQIVLLALLAIKLGTVSGTAESEIRKKLIASLKMLPRRVQNILDNKNLIAEIGKSLAKERSIFFIGRNINYATALEGALKMKEISYIHAEAQPAGELKHGHFALLTKDTPVIAIAVGDQTYQTTLATIGEVKARDARVLAIGDEHDVDIVKYADIVLRVPKTHPLLSPIPISVIFQLLAYYTAREKGCSIDKPRNLAKSVTVG